MFQTFSGSSRRPRQVNLSGQTLNPFAASSWTPSASGTQKTVAHAQQERQQRQQEREKLNASKQIQRTWRGHKARKELADSRRKTWDEIETGKSGPSMSESSLVEQLQLLVAFFNPRRRDDVDRLANLSQMIFAVGYEDFLARQEIQPQLVLLSKVSLEALQM
jgi:ubiquitin-protein ligase E3 C